MRDLDVRRDHESDPESADPRRERRDRRSEDRPQKEDREDRLDHDACGDRDPAAEPGRSDVCARERAWVELERVAQRESRDERAYRLRDPIRGHAGPGVLARDREPEGGGRVEVATGEAPEGRDRHGKSEPVRERDGDEVVAAGRDDRAGAHKEEQEGSRDLGQKSADVSGHAAAILHTWPTSAPSTRTRATSS